MEHQFKPHQPVVVRLHPNGKNRWYADFFSFYDNSLTLPYICTGGHWAECLPAEGNEHLVGTTDSPTPPDPDFKFGDKVEVSDSNKSFFKAIFLGMRPQYESPYFVITEEGVLPTRFKFCRHADWEE